MLKMAAVAIVTIGGAFMPVTATYHAPAKVTHPVVKRSSTAGNCERVEVTFTLNGKPETRDLVFCGDTSVPLTIVDCTASKPVSGMFFTTYSDCKAG